MLHAILEKRIREYGGVYERNKEMVCQRCHYDGTAMHRFSLLYSTDRYIPVTGSKSLYYNWI
mgnify:CR=1 FL=1